MFPSFQMCFVCIEKAYTQVSVTSTTERGKSGVIYIYIQEGLRVFMYVVSEREDGKNHDIEIRYLYARRVIHSKCFQLLFLRPQFYISA